MASNQFEALVAALCLAVVAPTEEQVGRAVKLAEEIAVGLPPETVEKAKRIAEERLR